MKRSSDDDRALEAMLEQGKKVPALPEQVRVRSLARARASIPDDVSAISTAPLTWGRRHKLTTALAAAAALLAMAAVADAALHTSLFFRAPVPRTSAPPASPVRLSGPRPPALELASDPEAGSPSPSPTGPTPGQPSYRAELRLLQHAQAAYTRGDFAAALRLVVQHRHRFPHGRLTEEREALRVRALAKSGRSDEARRAASAFAQRFPRSVFLPRLAEHP